MSKLYNKSRLSGLGQVTADDHFCMPTPMLKNHVDGCHGNHAFFMVQKEFIFEDKLSLHFWGPNE